MAAVLSALAWAAPQAMSAPVSIILDTDLASDVDDVGDVTVLSALATRGEANILAVITDSANPYSAPAAQAFLTYLGLGNTQVGAYHGTIPGGVAAGSVYTQQITAEFCETGASSANFPDAKTVYRQTLVAAEDGSVVIVSTGFFEPLLALLQSGGDANSEETGVQLIARKVAKLVVASGTYPSSNGSAGFNFRQDPAAASTLFGEWPTPIVCVGKELGDTVFSGPSVQADSAQDPVKRAYDLWGSSTRQAWGQLGVLYAVRGLSSGFRVLGSAGTNAVDPETGNNAWSPSPDHGHSYLGKVATDDALAGVLNGLLGAGPDGHPDFFRGEAPSTGGAYFLRFAKGNAFGYYSYLAAARYLYHYDLGYEYWFDAADGAGGIYLFDFKSGDFFYTSPKYPFPYLYDFALHTTLYYFPDPSRAGGYDTDGVRYFYDFGTSSIITR